MVMSNTRITEQRAHPPGGKRLFIGFAGVSVGNAPKASCAKPWRDVAALSIPISERGYCWLAQLVRIWYFVRFENPFRKAIAPDMCDQSVWNDCSFVTLL
jgi:hypothetical protein